MTMTPLTDLDEQLAGPEAEEFRAKLLGILAAGEERWKHRLPSFALSSPEFSNARALVKAYQAAIALLAPPIH